MGTMREQVRTSGAEFLFSTVWRFTHAGVESSEAARHDFACLLKPGGGAEVSLASRFLFKLLPFPRLLPTSSCVVGRSRARRSHPDAAHVPARVVDIWEAFAEQRRAVFSLRRRISRRRLADCRSFSLAEAAAAGLLAPPFPRRPS